MRAVRADGWRESKWGEPEQKGLQSRGDLKPRFIGPRVRAKLAPNRGLSELGGAAGMLGTLRAQTGALLHPCGPHAPGARDRSATGGLEGRE